MKTAYVLAFGILGLIPTVSGTVVNADNAAPVSALHQSAKIESELLATLKSQSAFSDSTLRRPL